MKTFFHSRAKLLLFLAPLLGAVLLISGYSAIANGRRSHTRQVSNTAEGSHGVQMPDRVSGPDVERDDDPEFVETRRQYLNWYFGISSKTLSPADHAAAMAVVRALPPSPLLQGRKFVSSQSYTAEGAAPSWTPPIAPPIGDIYSADSMNSAMVHTLGLDPVDSNVVYTGGFGGLTKSSDGGTTWRYLSDDWGSQAVSSISIDPNAPSHVYVGTGSDYALYGVGLYRSTDTGLNWDHLGVNEFAGTVIRTVAVDPHASGSTESTKLYVAADRSNSSSGLWRSTDGGATWSRLLTRGYNGIWGLAVDPSTNPSSLYIADSTGVSKSTDGVNWNLIYTSNSNWNSGVRLRVVNSVPYLLAPIAGSSPVYKLYYYPGIAPWIEIPTLLDGSPIGPWKFAVDPSDPSGNIILIGTAEFYRTTNKGGTWGNVRQQSAPNHDIHVDVQAIEFSPALTGLVYVGNDGGIWKSTAHGAGNTWTNLNQNLAGVLLYNVAMSQDGSMIAGTQDNGTVLSDAGGIWKIVLGGDSNRNLIDPMNSNIAYYTSYWANYFQRFNKSTGQSVSIRPSQFDSEPCNFFPAFSMNRASPNHLIVACQHLLRSRSQGAIWTTIGPSLADPNQPNEWWNTVNTASEAPSDSDVIYAVATGGRVLVTSDANQGANAHWTNITGNLGEVGGIFSIGVHSTNPQIAYLACGAGIYKTTTMGMGATPWTNLNAPAGPPGLASFGYRDLVLDPDNPGWIVIAGQMGVFSTVNDGATWENMSAGIPAGMLVSSLSFDRVHRKLAASTYGRGVYTVTWGDAPPVPTPTPSPTPTPTPPITVTLPTASFSTGVPTSTVIIQPVVATLIMERPSLGPNPDYPACLEADPECPPTVETHHGLKTFIGDFTFNSSVATFQIPYVRPAGLTANNWNVFASVFTNGATKTVRLSASGSVPLSGSGTLFELVMRRVSNTPGATSPLNWSASPDCFIFYDDVLPDPIVPNQTNGLITIVAPSPTPTPVDISGSVVYCSSPSLNPVPGVTLTVAGSASGSTLSNGSGNYLFSSLAPGGSYTITPSMAALSPGAGSIDIVDVVAVQRHVLAITPLPSGCPLAAADVNGDTLVNTSDVVAIQRFALMLPTGLANVGKYEFNPATRSYAPLTTSQTAQNFDTLAVGDVTSPFVGP